MSSSIAIASDSERASESRWNSPAYSRWLRSISRSISVAMGSAAGRTRPVGPTGRGDAETGA